MAENTLWPYPKRPLPKGLITLGDPWDSWFKRIERILGLRQSGLVTFAGSGTATVTFDRVERDTLYQLTLGGNANETFWWTNKTVTGFTARSSNAASNAILNYEVSR